MKKYLSIITLCVTSLVHGNGFENLKRLQDQVPALVYQAGDLGAPYSAPEIPHIAAKSGLPNHVALHGNLEAQYIYNALVSVGFIGMEVPNTFGTPESIAFEGNVNNFYHQFDFYQCRTGHTVFGIAAQEPAPPLAKVVISTPGAVISPMPIRPAAGGGGLLAALSGGGKTLKKASSEEKKSEAVSAPKSLLDRVKEYKEKVSSKVDIAILTELETELNKGAAVRNPVEEGHFVNLQEFFTLLTTEGPGMKNVVEQGRLDNAIKALRDKLKPKDVASLATSGEISPVPDGGSLKTQKVDAASLLSSATSSNLLNKAMGINSGGSATDDPGVIRLKSLKAEKETLEEDDDDEDWDSDDTKPKKTAKQKQEDKKRIKELDSEILALAERLAMDGVILDSAIENSNEKIKIYQRIDAYLRDLTSRNEGQEKIYGQVFSKLRTMDGGVARRASIANSSSASLIPNVGGDGLSNRSALPNIVVADHMTGGGGLAVNPAVAVDIDAQVEQKFAEDKFAIESEMARLQTELDQFDQKSRKEKGPAQQKAIGDLNTQLRAYIDGGKITATKMRIKGDLQRALKKK